MRNGLIRFGNPGILAVHVLHETREVEFLIQQILKLVGQNFLECLLDPELVYLFHGDTLTKLCWQD